MSSLNPEDYDNLAARVGAARAIWMSRESPMGRDPSTPQPSPRPFSTPQIGNRRQIRPGRDIHDPKQATDERDNGHHDSTLESNHGKLMPSNQELISVSSSNGASNGNGMAADADQGPETSDASSQVAKQRDAHLNGETNQNNEDKCAMVIRENGGNDTTYCDNHGSIMSEKDKKDVAKPHINGSSVSPKDGSSCDDPQNASSANSGSEPCRSRDIEPKKMPADEVKGPGALKPERCAWCKESNMEMCQLDDVKVVIIEDLMTTGCCSLGYHKICLKNMIVRNNGICPKCDKEISRQILIDFIGVLN